MCRGFKDNTYTGERWVLWRVWPGGTGAGGLGRRRGVQQIGHCTSPGELQGRARQGQKRSQEA